jgi:hypothetical protein
MKLYGSNEIISDYKQKDINFLASRLYKVNTVMFQAIYACAEFMSGDTINDFYNSEELMSKLAKAYKKICDKKGDEGFADMELHGADFQDFSYLVSKLQNCDESEG